MILGLRALVHVETAVRGLLPTGPLGPSDIDPDDIRDDACDLTVPDDLCSEPAPVESAEPPTEAPDLPEPPIQAGAGAAQLLVILLAVGLIVALIFVLVRYFGDGRSADDDDTDIDDGDLDEEIDEEVEERVVDHESPPDRWRRRAAEAREQQHYRESVRCEYRALVGELARAGHVDEIPGRTSGEERAQLHDLAPSLGAHGHEVATQFDTAADIFDAAWFNDDAVTAANDQNFVAASTAVLDVVLASSRRLGGRRS